jgi:hypothetical protein
MEIWYENTINSYDEYLDCQMQFQFYESKNVKFMNELKEKQILKNKETIKKLKTKKYRKLRRNRNTPQRDNGGGGNEDSEDSYDDLDKKL